MYFIRKPKLSCKNNKMGIFTQFCLFVSLFNKNIKNILLIWRRQRCLWKTAKFRHIKPLSREGSLSCHTCSDTRPRFFAVSFKGLSKISRFHFRDPDHHRTFSSLSISHHYHLKRNVFLVSEYCKQGEYKWLHNSNMIL